MAGCERMAMRSAESRRSRFDRVRDFDAFYERFNIWFVKRTEQIGVADLSR